MKKDDQKEFTEELTNAIQLVVNKYLQEFYKRGFEDCAAVRAQNDLGTNEKRQFYQEAWDTVKYYLSLGYPTMYELSKFMENDPVEAVDWYKKEQAKKQKKDSSLKKQELRIKEMKARCKTCIHANDAFDCHHFCVPYDFDHYKKADDIRSCDNCEYVYKHFYPCCNFKGYSQWELLKSCRNCGWAVKGVGRDILVCSNKNTCLKFSEFKPKQAGVISQEEFDGLLKALQEEPTDEIKEKTKEATNEFMEKLKSGYYKPRRQEAQELVKKFEEDEV